MKKNLPLIIGLVVVVAIVLIVVLKPESERPVALIMKTLNNEFFQTMERGGREAAKEIGVKLRVESISRETAAEEQAQRVEAMVGQNVAAILIAPSDSKSLVKPLLLANKAGIPIINIDNPLDAETVKAQGLELVSYIGTDNVKGAYMSTKELIRALGGEGKVVMLEGIRAADNAQKRRQGFLKAIGETNGKVIELYHDTANWETEQAYNVFATILQNYPDMDGLFCANDNMALGAIRAIETAGKTGKILVAGFDNLKAAQEEIMKGTLHCTIDQHPEWMAAEGVKMAKRLMEGEAIGKDERTKLVELELITKEVLLEKQKEKAK
jgi:ribose transport system substrate-binding protein